MLRFYYRWRRPYSIEKIEAIIKANDINLLEEAIRLGFDIGTTNQYGWTALHSAVAGRNLEAIQVLLQSPGIQVNAKDNDGETPLHMAAFYGYDPAQYGSTQPNNYKEIIALLINAGANRDARNGEGKTPFDIAVHFKYAESEAADLLHPNRVLQTSKYKWF